MKGLYKAYSQHDLDAGAAAISFFLFFAIFPLIILVIVGSSLFLGAQESRELFGYAFRVQPFLAPLIQGLFEDAGRNAGTLGLIGLLGLVWSVSGSFIYLQRMLDAIYGIKKQRSIWAARTINIVIIVFLGLILIINAVFSLIFINFLHIFYGLEVLFGYAISFIAYFLTATLFYSVLPSKMLSPLRVYSGALFSAFLWLVGEGLFNIYVQQFARFNLVFGSFGLAAALLLWIYVSVTVFLFGAVLNKKYLPVT